MPFVRMVKLVRVGYLLKPALLGSVLLASMAGQALAEDCFLKVNTAGAHAPAAAHRPPAHRPAHRPHAAAVHKAAAPLAAQPVATPRRVHRKAIHKATLVSTH